MSTKTAEFDVAGMKYTARLIDVDIAQKEAALLSQVAGKTALRGGMRALLKVLRAGLLQKLPRRRSGKLRRAIRTKIRIQAARSLLEGRITLGTREAWYAKILERGTGVYGKKGSPFDVRPKAKKAIMIPGMAHPVARAKVKGIRPMRMVQRTEQQDMGAARRAFRDAFDQEVRRVKMNVWKI